jgi:quercetin dioxygenase-like cupin family protein
MFLASLCGCVGLLSSLPGAASPAAQLPLPDPKGALITGRSTILDAKDVVVDRRSFTPGSRSYWHSHPGGQLILIQEGRAWFQIRGQPVRELRAGDSVFTPPNAPHWHGATPVDARTQLTMGFPGATVWMEPVTDQEYTAPVSR